MLYLLGDEYIGHTSKPLQVRLNEHIAQAIRDHRTNKDKALFAQLVSGQTLQIQELFPSTLYETNDETFTIWFFQNVLGFEMLNTALGQGVLTVERLKKLPVISSTCKNWVMSAAEAVGETELMKDIFSSIRTFDSSAQVGEANTVTMNKKTTLVVLEVADIQFKDHKFGGQNTPIIKYKWLNTNRAGNEHKVHGEAFVDTAHQCSHWQVGQQWAVWTTKEVAPDNPNTLRWNWADQQPFTKQWRATQLAERLERIEAIWDLKPEFRPFLKNQKSETLRCLKDLTNAKLW